MRRQHLLAIAGFVALLTLTLHGQRSHFIPLGPYAFGEFIPDATALTLHRLDADTERFACKFYAGTTSAITAVDLNVTVAGTVTGVNFTYEIQTDSSGSPSGTPVGTATAAWAGPAATGFTGAKTLGTDTGALTLNTPYWVVVVRTSGSSVSGANYIEPRIQANFRHNRDTVRHHTGTNWTTTAASNNPCIGVLTHADGSFTGHPQTGAAAANFATNDIAGNARQGLRFKVGAPITLLGWRVKLGKVGSPSDVEIVTYEGDTAKGTCTLTAAQVANIDTVICWYTTPPELAADVNLYGLLRQAANGGTAAVNYYDLRAVPINSSYTAAVYPVDMRMVYGTGDTPSSGYTVVTSDVPVMNPIIADPASDLNSTGGSATKRVIGG